MLSGLMSGLVPVNGANESQTLPADAAWRLKFTPGAGFDLSQMQLAIDNSDLLNGAVGIVQEAGAVTLTGKSAQEHEAASMFRAALLDLIDNFTAPTAVVFEADLSGQAQTTGTGANNNSSQTGSSWSMPATIFGLPSHFVLIGGAALLLYFNSQGKGK